MVKKPVPDWLNNSLWSTAPPPPSPTPNHDDDHRIVKSISSDSAPAYSSSTSESTSNTITTPPIRQQVTAPEVEIRDPLSGSNNVENWSISTVEIRDPTGDDVSVQAQLLQELSRKVIDIGELRRLASQGIPDGAGIRCTVWKLLLGFLPTDRGLWSSELAKKRSQYKHFKEELLMNPLRHGEHPLSLENEESLPETGVVLPRSEITYGEHPLSLGKSSVWNQFFQAPSTPKTPVTTPVSPSPKAKKPVWCLPKGGVSDGQWQANLDYACGQPGIDCSPIQPGGACFEPNTLASHAAYAMDLLYQSSSKNPWNCDFSQTATLSCNNPSYNGCNYPGGSK